MGWGNKFPDMKNDPTYLEGRLSNAETSLAELMQQQAPVTPTSVKIANGKKKTIYLWQFTWVQTQPDAIVSNLVSENITDIFIQWSTTITTAQWQYFIGACSAKGISVWALDGDESWITTPSYGTTDINNVIAYNNSVSANQKFVGVHFDVEPSAADQSSSTTLQTWYQNHVTWATQCHQNGLLFAGSFQKAMTTLTTSYGVNNPNSKPFYQLLIDVVDLFVMMDYTTNTTTAENNIAPAINYATSPKVILGIETTNVTPSSITFYSSGYAAANSALTTYDSLYTSNVGYAGVSIHDYEQWSAFLIAIKIANGNSISVKDSQFGAKGDGTTDDTTAIQNAFNSAQTIGNADIYFPDGIYVISNYIKVYKNTTVRFHPDAVVKRNGTYYKMFVNGDLTNKSYDPNGVYTGEGNIHFIGGTFDLNCQVGNTSGISTTQTVNFFDIGHAENISFDSITVKNGQIGHYFEISSCKNIRFTNCWFGAVNYTGDHTNYDYECIQIEVATTDSFPDFGAYDLTISRDILVENCTFDGVVRAIGTHSDGKYGTTSVVFCENIKFINNKIFNSIDHSVILTGYRYVTFKDNLILNSAGYGIDLVSVEDSVISGNIVLSPKKSALNMSLVNNVKFRDNIYKDASWNGGAYAAIRLTTCNGNTFDNETVSAVGTVKYTYAWYSSGGSTGNKVKNHNFTSGTTSIIKDADGNHIERVTGLILGTAVPTVIPEFKGQEFLDTTNKKVYKAINTTASADWILLN